MDLHPQRAGLSLTPFALLISSLTCPQMANTNMGPPPTRDPPRRSGRSARTTCSNSQSPEGSEPSGSQRGSMGQQQQPQPRPGLVSTGSGSNRSKKLKVEDEDLTVGDAGNAGDVGDDENGTSAGSNVNGRSKRKTKERDRENIALDDTIREEETGAGANDDETRCVCGDGGQSTGTFFSCFSLLNGRKKSRGYRKQ